MKKIENFVKNTFNEYLGKSDWRVKENSNSFFSLGGLNKYVLSKDSAIYWTQIYNSYNPEIMKTHNLGKAHAHDLGSFSSYCYGASLKELLIQGVRGIPNVSVSAPAKRLRSITAQIANIVTIFQNEVAGAVAFSSWNTYLAPFVYFDKLRRENIKDEGKKLNLKYNKNDIDDITESIQNMIYALNSNSRMGSEPAFSNFTLDFHVLKPMQKENIIIDGKYNQDYVYSDFQHEADLLTHIFSKLMYNGDAEGQVFSYPIPTFNVSKSVDFDNPYFKYVWEMSGKYGNPYFANFIKGDLSEDDCRSMCCRLRLDVRELVKKSGGLFGAGEQTGSIGVFTLNLPMIAYENKGNKKAMLKEIKRVMNIGKEQLVIKKAVVVDAFNKGLFPALKQYTPNMETMFLTIGMVGGNEMCLNFSDGKFDISDIKGQILMEEIMNYMLNIIQDFQEETGFLFNLEATPAEGATYRLAKKSKELYPDIITAGHDDNIYFTNSVHLPVDIDWTYRDIYSHQENLLSKFTGGSVYHNYLAHSLSGEIVKQQIKTIFENYNIPYISNSPIYGICPEHGYIESPEEVCPFCGKEIELYQRVTGYIRKVSNFNKGKHQEFIERRQKNLDEIA